MSKILTLDQLRLRLLDTFEKLTDGEIDIDEAMALSKLSDSISSGVNLQLKYAQLTQSSPHIPFLESNNRIIDAESKKKMIDNDKS